MATKTDQKQQLSSTNLFIILALVTLLAVGITVLVAKAMVASIVLDNKVVAAKSKADKNLSTDLDAAPKLVDAFSAMGSQAGVLADALPTTSDLPALLVELENMGNDAGVNLKTVAPNLVNNATPTATTGSPTATTGTGTSGTTDSTQAPQPQAYDFSVTFDGTYQTMGKLLQNLETSARPMRVVGIQASGSGSALSVELDVETYFMDKAVLPIGKETIK